MNEQINDNETAQVWIHLCRAILRSETHILSRDEQLKLFDALMTNDREQCSPGPYRHLCVPVGGRGRAVGEVTT